MNLELNKNKTNFKQQFKKRCFDFSLSVIRISEQLRGQRINWSLLDQIIRSATSIGANVVEGGNSSTKKEFINYFQIALKSASETLYWLALLKELNIQNSKELDSMLQECTEIKKIIITVILNTKSNSKL